jgi:hypothetical protein
MAHLRLIPADSSDAMRALTVAWDRVQQKFVARDDQGALLGTFPNQSNAIGSAIREARHLASRNGSRVLVQVLQQNGTFRNEFIAQPPPRF